MVRAQNALWNLEQDYLLKYNTDTLNLISGMLWGGELAENFELVGSDVDLLVPRSFFLPGNCTPEKTKQITLSYPGGYTYEVSRNKNGSLKSIYYRFSKKNRWRYFISYSGNTVIVRRKRYDRKNTPPQINTYYYGTNNLPDSIQLNWGSHVSVYKTEFQNAVPIALRTTDYHETYNYTDATIFRKSLPEAAQEQLTSLLCGDSLTSAISMSMDYRGTRDAKLIYIFRSSGCLIVLRIRKGEWPRDVSPASLYQWECLRWNKKGAFDKAIFFENGSKDTIKIVDCTNFSTVSWHSDKLYSSRSIIENSDYELNLIFNENRISARTVSFYRR